MMVSKETAEKAAEYEKLKNQCDELVKKMEQLHKEITDRLSEDGADMESCFIGDYFIADEPTGKPQCGGEWCEQHSGWREDDYYGNYYYPIEGSDKYLGFSYEC